MVSSERNQTWKRLGERRESVLGSGSEAEVKSNMVANLLDRELLPVTREHTVHTEKRLHCGLQLPLHHCEMPT